nr:hypothetical protein [Rhizobium leguminosarum]
MRPDQPPKPAAGIELVELQLGMPAQGIAVKIPPRNAVKDHDDAGTFLEEACNAFGSGCQLMPLEAGDDEILRRQCLGIVGRGEADIERPFCIGFAQAETVVANGVEMGSTRDDGDGGVVSGLARKLNGDSAAECASAIDADGLDGHARLFLVG